MMAIHSMMLRTLARLEEGGGAAGAGNATGGGGGGVSSGVELVSGSDT